MAQARGLLLRASTQLLNCNRSGSCFTLSRSFTDSKLFVGGLSFETTEDSLREVFSKHGDIMDLRIISDRATGKSRGFGFVTYSKELDAETALTKLHGHIIDGRSIRVDRASARPSPSRPAAAEEGDHCVTSMGFGESSPKSSKDWASMADTVSSPRSSTPSHFAVDDDDGGSDSQDDTVGFGGR